jgi:hypothetical protein
MATSTRGPALTACALLFGLLALSNFAKPVTLGPTPGFVLLGRRLSGATSAAVGSLFGLYLLVYAAGIWRMQRWALPMGVLYAAYVIANLLLFVVRDPEPMREGLLFTGVYTVVAIGVSSGTVWLLAQRRAGLT